MKGELPGHNTTTLPVPLPADHERVALPLAFGVICNPVSALGAVPPAWFDTVRLKFANWAGKLAPPAKSACSIPTSNGKPAKSSRLNDATLVQAAVAGPLSKKVKLFHARVILSQKLVVG